MHSWIIGEKTQAESGGIHAQTSLCSLIPRRGKAYRNVATCVMFLPKEALQRLSTQDFSWMLIMC